MRGALGGRAPAPGLRGADEIEVRRVARILDERARTLDERQRGVQASRVERRLGGAAQAPAPRAGSSSERSAARSKVTAAVACAVARDRLRRRRLELPGERLVGAVGHHRAMPRARSRGRSTAAASASWASRRSLRVAAR